MDGNIKLGDVLTDAEIDRAWHCLMGTDDDERFRSWCMDNVVLPAVERYNRASGRAVPAEHVFGTLSSTLRLQLKATADEIRAQDAAKAAGFR